MWSEYITAANVDEVVELLSEKKGKARIIAGATDLIIELEQGAHSDIDTFVDVTRIEGLDQIVLDDEGAIHLGALVTHNQCAASRLVIERAFPLAEACWVVGAAQIRNRGTVAGNLVTASPANDSITPLLALNARVTLKSKAGERVVPLSEFYTGVRKTLLQPDEMLVRISFPALDPEKQRGGFIKLGLRAAQAISVVNVAAVVTLDGGKVSAASITLGSVAPTVRHAGEAEAYLVGKALDDAVISQAAELAMGASSPIDDIRGTANYRRLMVKALSARLLTDLRDGQQGKGYPQNPIQVAVQPPAGQLPPGDAGFTHQEGTPIKARVNGKEVVFKNVNGKTLLWMLREQALLTGTKEGCSEGECGACTVIMDGAAVMSCLVPAARAHGADIRTVEGLATDEGLHPVQQTFVEDGAVQCGYCTPGMLMTAAALIEERPSPTREDIKYAIAGNLCRCTGYHKIIEAIEHASVQGS